METPTPDFRLRASAFHNHDEEEIQNVQGTCVSPPGTQWQSWMPTWGLLRPDLVCPQPSTPSTFWCGWRHMALDVIFLKPFTVEGIGDCPALGHLAVNVSISSPWFLLEKLRSHLMFLQTSDSVVNVPFQWVQPACYKESSIFWQLYFFLGYLHFYYKNGPYKKKKRQKGWAVAYFLETEIPKQVFPLR